MISVVIPAHNEESNIAEVVDGVTRLGLDNIEIIVIDDGSTDETARVAAKAGARVVRHPYNIGNGASVKTGIRQARGDIIVTMDGDGQHDPADIPRLLDLMKFHDMAVGARTLSETGSLHRNLANKLFNSLASYIAGREIEDLTSGFRAVRAKLAKSLVALLPNTFSYPSTITLAVCKYGYSLAYVQIATRRREGGSSKINPLRDGSRFILIIIRVGVLFSPLKIFIPLSALFAVVGLVHLLNTLVTLGRFMPFSLGMFITSVLLFSLGMVSYQVSMLRLLIAEREGK